MAKKIKKDFWNKDITNELLISLSMFGLVVSSVVATSGVAALGVQAQLALANMGPSNAQAAAAELGDSRPEHPLIPVSVGIKPPPRDVASSTRPAMASSTLAKYCPQITRSLARGGKDSGDKQDVRELQHFLAQKYNLDASTTITGFFGSTTQAYVQRFQKEEGLPVAANVGPLTRAAIARLCNPSSHDPENTKGDIRREGGSEHGSSTPPMGSTTPKMHPRDMPPPPPTTSFAPGNEVYAQNYGGSSNAANVLSALAQISDGYGKLLGATLSLIGL